MPRRNNAVSNFQLRKKWDLRVKTHFNDPAKRIKRSNARKARAARLFPSPVSKLHPAVRISGLRHNSRLRLGRGFTYSELHAAMWSPKEARKYGVTIDKRRRNQSVNSLALNTQRLKLYKEKLIVLPKYWATPGVAHPLKNPKIQKAIAERKDFKPYKKFDWKNTKIKQNTDHVVLPLTPHTPVTEFRAITEKDRKRDVYSLLVKLRKANRPVRHKLKKINHAKKIAALKKVK